MQIIRLVAYALLGYVLYELYLGVTEGSGIASQPAPSARRGGVRGRKVKVEDQGGATHTQSVGRGVVH
jgi:hypothetical protein